MLGMASDLRVQAFETARAQPAERVFAADVEAMVIDNVRLQLTGIDVVLNDVPAYSQQMRQLIRGVVALVHESVDQISLGQRLPSFVHPAALLSF
jgi:hypothetical protein